MGDLRQTAAEPQRATMIDVAKSAGVSFKTVSRVLNGESNVRAETRKTVMAAAEQLDYKLNVAARSLRVGGPQIIALLAQNPSRAYIESAHLGALQSCHKAGMHLIMDEIDDTVSDVEALLKNTSPVGVIVTPPLCDDKELLALLDKRKIRYVLIAPSETSPHRASINIDDVAAARDMTNYLIKLGHKRIGFIMGHPEHSAAKRRFDGYKEAMRDAGLKVSNDMLEEGYFSYASGLACAEKLLDQVEPPSAIFASNDDMAAAVIAAAYRRNIHIPDDLSVVGFDNTQVAAVISPQLTTINQPIGELISSAVAMLADQSFRSDDAIAPVFMDYKIVKRESAGPANMSAE